MIKRKRRVWRLWTRVCGPAAWDVDAEPQPGSRGPSGSFFGSGLGSGEWRPLELRPGVSSAHCVLWEAEESWYPINTCWVKIELWKGSPEEMSGWTYRTSELRPDKFPLTFSVRLPPEWRIAGKGWLRWVPSANQSDCVSAAWFHGHRINEVKQSELWVLRGHSHAPWAGSGVEESWCGGKGTTPAGRSPSSSAQMCSSKPFRQHKACSCYMCFPWFQKQYVKDSPVGR